MTDFQLKYRPTQFPMLLPDIQKACQILAKKIATESSLVNSFWGSWGSGMTTSARLASTEVPDGK